MNIAFIGFGKVAFNLVKLIKSPNINFSTSIQNRSENTINLINKSNVEVYGSFREAIKNADIVVSANSPSTAFEVANSYAKYVNAIYLDLNSVSPKTSIKISKLMDNFVDGSIIGKIDSKNPTIYLSGKKVSELLFLNEFLNVKIISDKVGDASKLKLLRSTYTKSLSVLLIECHSLAKSLDLEEEFFDILSLTEGTDFKEKSLSRINNTLNNSKRKNEELEEILDYFHEDDLKILKAALEKLKQF